MGKFSIIVAAFIIMGCSKSREVVEQEQVGGVTVAASLEATAEIGNERSERATACTNLYVDLLHDDGSLLFQTSTEVNQSVEFITIPAITEGVGYQAIAWSENDDGDTIHAPSVKTFDVEASKQTTITFELIARCGSILFNIVEIPTAVDSLFLTFESDSGTFTVAEKRDTRQFLSLDNIPYEATGELRFWMVREDGSTISDWDTLFTFTKENTTEIFSLINNGTVVAQVSLEESAIATFSATADTTDMLRTESGELIITEFCATGGSSKTSSEFIKLYNSKAESFHADELIISDGTRFHTLQDITIPAGENFILAAEEGMFWNPDATTNNFDISSTSGMISVVADGVMIDYVIFFNDTESGWEKLSSSAKTSWILTGELSANGNNSPSNWSSSTNEVIHKEVYWYGIGGTE